MGSRRWRALLVLVLATAAVAGACSSDASTRAGNDGAASGSGEGGPTTTAAPVAVPGEVPPGTTLRVGDQIEYLQTLLRLAGEDEGLPYDVEYAAFLGGPPMLQAFQGAAVDIGFVASTPLIFAHAQGQEIRAVAGWATDGGPYTLVTAPGEDEIGGWGDLAGRRVAYQRGTAGEAALLQELEVAGVAPEDVVPVDVAQSGAALQSGSADAAVSVEPLTSTYLAGNPTARVVDTADELTTRSQFLIASRDTLDDEARSAALADYLTRLVRSFAYLRANPDLVAHAIYVEQYGLTPERADEIVEAQGVPSFIDLDGEIVDEQQELAELFVAAGQIPAELDVAAEFDGRFNELIQQAGDG